MSLPVQDGKLQIDALKGGATDQFSSETSPGKYGSCSNPRRCRTDLGHLRLKKLEESSNSDPGGTLFGDLFRNISCGFWGFDGDFPRNSWVSVSPDQYLPAGKLLCLVMDGGAVGAL